MIPFRLAHVTNTSMLSLAVYLVHHDKVLNKVFFTAIALTRLQ